MDTVRAYYNDDTKRTELKVNGITVARGLDRLKVFGLRGDLRHCLERDYRNLNALRLKKEREEGER